MSERALELLKEEQRRQRGIDESVEALKEYLANPIPDVAGHIVTEILDVGLAESTWAGQFPEAYKELLKYRPDMIASARKFVKF